LIPQICSAASTIAAAECDTEIAHLGQMFPFVDVPAIFGCALADYCVTLLVLNQQFSGA
jgi:hypothetical protein